MRSENTPSLRLHRLIYDAITGVVDDHGLDVSFVSAEAITHAVMGLFDARGITVKYSIVGNSPGWEDEPWTIHTYEDRARAIAYAKEANSKPDTTAQAYMHICTEVAVPLEEE